MLSVTKQMQFYITIYKNDLYQVYFDFQVFSTYSDFIIVNLITHVKEELLQD